MKDNSKFGSSQSLIDSVNEVLKGGQKKLDKNHNGKLDGQDFKILRKEAKEGSAEDKKQDKAGMKRTGMTAKEWEKSAEDKKEDMKEANWIKGAIKHPGAMTAAAKRAGETDSEYEQQHKHDSGKAGRRARLALTLKKMHEEKLDEANHRDFASAGMMHPDMAKHMNVGDHMDYYEPKTGDKVHGKVMHKSDGEVHMKQTHDSYNPKKVGSIHRFKVSSSLPDQEMKEEVAASKTQQRAAGAALATQRGEYDGGKKGGAINRMAAMKPSDLMKIAGTKTKELPMRKEDAEQADEGTVDQLGDRIDNAKSTEHAKSIIAKAPTKHLQYLHRWNMGFSGVSTHKYIPHIKSELSSRKSKVQVVSPSRKAVLTKEDAVMKAIKSMKAMKAKESTNC